MPPSLPTVSAMMPAYNYEQYVGRAVESALTQDYPPELLEVVVVDDGSTDSTAEIVEDLARRNPGRVRLIRQANAGPSAATNRALSEARGELLAVLDADDVWLPHKTRRQVEMLSERPTRGLAFSDMAVVDAREEIVNPSLLGADFVMPERALARVLFGNVATQSSIMIRASLRERFDPIPEGIPYSDWWFTLRAAEVSEIGFSREALALYRVHGTNLTGGVNGAGAVRENRKALSFQFRALRLVDLDDLSPEELLYVWSGVELRAKMAMAAAESCFVELFEVTDDDRARARELLAAAESREAGGDLAGEARLALRALAFDPYLFAAHERLRDGVARAADAAPAEPPHPLSGARRFVVLVDAGELLAREDMIRAYADAFSGSHGVTLAIDASALPVDDAEHELRALVERCQLGEREDIDLLAVLGAQDGAERGRMLSAVHARYAGQDSHVDGLPTFTPDTLDRLRALAHGG